MMGSLQEEIAQAQLAKDTLAELEKAAADLPKLRQQALSEKRNQHALKELEAAKKELAEVTAEVIPQMTIYHERARALEQEIAKLAACLRWTYERMRPAAHRVARACSSVVWSTAPPEAGSDKMLQEKLKYEVDDVIGSEMPKLPPVISPWSQKPGDDGINYIINSIVLPQCQGRVFNPFHPLQ